VWTRSMYTSSSRGSKRKADKNVDADFTSCLALGEGKPAPPTKSGKPRNRLFRVSGLVTLVSSRRFPTQTTTVQQMADQPHPLRACSLVVWQCIAFATSFLLASQTTSVVATASCMTTSYTTTKLSHSPMSQAPGKRGTAHQSYAMWRERTHGLGATSLHVIWGIDN
jgi:hypothetical protein